MNKKFYITTSIPYVNSLPHIGNILDSLYADVLARYKRQRGFDVRFLTGTDEHGAKLVRAAEAAGLSVKELVDKNSAQFRYLKEIFNLSWDDFIRTSDQKRHWPGVQKLWQILYKNGDLYKKTYRGLYCVGHEAFITEKDMINGKCCDHQTAPAIIEEENWFFRLSKYSKQIELKIKNNELRIVPESRKNEILSLIKEGLEDVSFSRPSKDLSWGIPVPYDPSQTIYVWADALVNYISALGYGLSDENLFKKYWPADVQVIGKDNLRFHAAIWLGMLISAGLELPKIIFVHGFLTVNGQKISKTIGNVIDPMNLIKKYGVDAIRYFLLREISAYEDGDFSEIKLKERYNADLANGLGNFAARVSALGEKAGPIKINFRQDAEQDVIKKIEETKKESEQKINQFKFHEALKVLWGLISFGDQYINQHQLWKTPKKIYPLLVILDNLGSLLEPFLPQTTKKIRENIQWISQDNLKVIKIDVLFPRI